MQDNLVITYFSTPHPPTHTPFYNHSYSIFTSMYLTQIVIISKIESNHCTVKEKKELIFISTQRKQCTLVYHNTGWLNSTTKETDSVFDFKDHKHTWFRAKAVMISCSLWMIFIGSFIFRLFSDSACAFVSYHKQSFNSDQYSPGYDNHTTLIKESVLIPKKISFLLIVWMSTYFWLVDLFPKYISDEHFFQGLLLDEVEPESLNGQSRVSISGKPRK